MSTPCTNCQYLAYSCVCENPTYFSFLLQDEKEEENPGSETKLGKKLRSRVMVF